MLRFYDTAAARVVDLQPRDEGAISMYNCGLTVYAAPHIGHGRGALVYDMLRRYLEWRGFRVHQVSNITDIDDKIIARANEERRPWQELTAEWESVWWDLVDKLGVARPDDTPHATDYVGEMVDLIGQLVRSGHAYETGDGVYLETSTVPDYGLLAHQSLDSLRAGARVEVVEDKRSHLDFALWKRTKPDEPSWPSPFGEGRPGWHTECVVMSLGILGEGFDLHGGGLDLMFPHHENERAQAVAAGRRFTRHWLHNGMVTMSGEKMSKSLGNFVTLGDLLGEVDPRSYRLLVLRSKYRSPLEVTDEILSEAATSIERLDSLARRYGDYAGAPTEEATALRERFIEAMDDDLDSPSATGELFEALRRANSLGDAGDMTGAGALAVQVLELFGALGLVAAGQSDVPPDVRAAVAEIDAARARADYATADALRARLASMGWRAENTPSGTQVRRISPGQNT